MKHEMKSRYPAPAAVVLKMFADPAFHTRKLQALGVARYELLASGQDGDEHYVRIERKVPISLPGMKGENSVTSEERWNHAQKTGRVSVQTQGIPIQMSCEATVGDEGAESVVTYRWTIEAKLPIVGATLEKFVVADMEKRSAAETEAGIQLLTDYR
jgi:hypothetical protein